uniref:Uncharacterized protein n=1 Tax=Gopherus evgoodei TaxID=1825980 RepID=A0A8C4WAM4_9SAUR
MNRPEQNVSDYKKWMKLGSIMSGRLFSETNMKSFGKDCSRGCECFPEKGGRVSTNNNLLFYFTILPIAVLDCLNEATKRTSETKI